MKKLVIALVAILGLVGSVGLVYAANNGSDSINKTCEITGCVIAEAHSHELCQVTGCNETGNHEHDGVLYYGHHTDDGHAYHNCGVVGCTENGEHSHSDASKEHGNGHHGGHH